MAVKKKTSKKKVTKKASQKPNGHCKFDVALIPVIKNLCKVGKTNAEIAFLLDICEKTLYNWMKEYPELLHTMQKWKQTADEEVERSLFQTANGYIAKETRVFWTKEGSIKTHNMLKQHAPNVQAQQYWLNNRSSKRWKNKVEHAFGEDMVTEFTLNYKQGDSKKKKKA